MGSLSLEEARTRLANLTRVKLSSDKAIEQVYGLMEKKGWTVVLSSDGTFGLDRNQLTALNQAGIPHQVVRGSPFRIARDNVR